MRDDRKLLDSESGKLVSLAGLKARGWTVGLVAKFLGTPDELGRNPRYRNAAPVRLYALDRVEIAEAGADFAEAIGRTAKSRAAAAKAVATKKTALLSLVATMTVKVDTLPLNEVRRLAREHYEARKQTCIEADAPREFLDRVTVNFVRHQMTLYDESLEEVAGRTGIVAAVTEIRRKVYRAIADAYPDLLPECLDQQSLREARVATTRSWT